jgi:selenocysteine lyase/cysteine desulfurase
VKRAEKRWFNGFRLSPHVFDSEDDIERALHAIRSVLA